MNSVEMAKEQFGELIQSEFERIERMKADNMVKDFSKSDRIVVGVMPGDGIGPLIMKQALRVMEVLMKPELESGKIEVRQIEGMTIENRAALMQSLPEDVFEEVKQCDVLLKGPMAVSYTHLNTGILRKSIYTRRWPMWSVRIFPPGTPFSLTGRLERRIMEPPARATEMDLPGPEARRGASTELRWATGIQSAKNISICLKELPAIISIRCV